MTGLPPGVLSAEVDLISSLTLQADWISTMTTPADVVSNPTQSAVDEPGVTSPAKPINLGSSIISTKRKRVEDESTDTKDHPTSKKLMSEDPRSFDSLSGTILGHDLAGDSQLSQAFSAQQRKRAHEDPEPEKNVEEPPTKKMKYQPGDRLPSGQKVRKYKQPKKGTKKPSIFVEIKETNNTASKPVAGGLFARLPQEIRAQIGEYVMLPMRNPKFIRRPYKHAKTGVNEPGQTMLDTAILQTCKSVYLQFREVLPMHCTAALPTRRKPWTGFQLPPHDQAALLLFRRVQLRPFVTTAMRYRHPSGREEGPGKIGRAFTEIVEVLRGWEVANPDVGMGKEVQVQFQMLHHDQVPGKEERRAEHLKAQTSFLGQFRREMEVVAGGVKVVHVKQEDKKKKKDRG